MSTDYGTDLWARQTLSTTRTVKGVALIVNALVRRLTTPKGRLIFHRGYGLALDSYVGDEMATATRFRVETEVRDQIESDPRIYRDSVRVSVVEVAGPNGSDLQISASGDSQLGPFDFVATVDKVNLSLLKLEAA